ncbi:MAG: hypothetical protein EPO35_09980 [Acidobacteria bacterium]|nr:MAG: hypothetical protein EPO35_09980 [Acidobacteriota bacterium]
MNVLLTLLLVAFGLPQAQAPAPGPTPSKDAKLIVTVTDQTAAVLPGATVTITGLDAATKLVAPIVTHTADKGVATVQDLAVGLYSVRIDMDGFNSMLIPDVKLAKGENKRNVTMPLRSMSETVTVQRDRQIVAADRGSVTFGSTLTREQIEALPDDPVELERVLREMAGGDAVIKVDSFEGAQLPQKSQIKAIHISRDQFAAENHFAGGISIDIVTQAGSGPFRMNGNYGLGDSALNGKSPLVPSKGASRNQNFGFGGGGTVIPNRLSMSFNGGVFRGFNEPNIYANTVNGLVSEASKLRSRSTGFNLYGDVTYALTKDQTLRVYYSQFNSDDRNNGVGDYNLIDRAYSSKSTSRSIRGQEAGPLGRRFVTNTKFAVSWNESSTTSATEAPTISVIQQFTSGGAQRKGGRTTRDFMIQSDLDYVRGIHTVRLGVVANGGNYRSDDASNYLGTYTFESLDAFLSGRARSYTRRIGDPLIEYFNTQAGIYLQDDIRLRKNLSFSPGIRYEVQTHLRDWKALGPRFGFTWAPFKSGRTSVRASWGIFYDWLGTGLYEQALRVDGFRQQELSILNPSYPNPGAVGTVSIGNKYLLDPNLEMPRNQRVSGGIDQQVGKLGRISATYSYTLNTESFRGENLNAPVNGIRPDKNFNNIVRVVADGQARAHQLIASGSIQFAAPTPALQQARFNIRRGGINASYFYGNSRNNIDGAFQTPASGDIANEWGPANFDVRHRVNVGLNSQALKNLSINLNLSAATGSPYNITTGRDDNGDFFFNDRPIGTTRNSARGDGQWTLNANLNYNMTFGKPAGGGLGGMPMGPGVVIMSPAGGGGDARVAIEGMVRGAMAQQPGRYRLSIFVRVQNLTNHANPFGYAGAMTSNLFGKPTSYQGVRQVNLGMNFGF